MEPREPEHQNPPAPRREAGSEEIHEYPRHTPGTAEGLDGEERHDMPQKEPGKTPGNAEG